MATYQPADIQGAADGSYRVLLRWPHGTEVFFTGFMFNEHYARQRADAINDIVRAWITSDTTSLSALTTDQLLAEIRRRIEDTEVDKTAADSAPPLVSEGAQMDTVEPQLWDFETKELIGPATPAHIEAAGYRALPFFINRDGDPLPILSVARDAPGVRRVYVA